MSRIDDWAVRSMSEDQIRLLGELYSTRRELAGVQATLNELKERVLASPTPQNIENRDDYIRISVDPVKMRIADTTQRLMATAIDREKMSSIMPDITSALRGQITGIIFGVLTSGSGQSWGERLSLDGLRSTLSGNLQSVLPMVVTLLTQAVSLPIMLELVDNESMPSSQIHDMLDKFLKEGSLGGDFGSLGF